MRGAPRTAAVEWDGLADGPMVATRRHWDLALSRLIWCISLAVYLPLSRAYCALGPSRGRDFLRRGFDEVLVSGTIPISHDIHGQTEGSVRATVHGGIRLALRSGSIEFVKSTPI